MDFIIFEGMSDLADTEMRTQMGRRLKRVRLALGLTQAQIVNGFGITVTGWSAWENGRNTPDLLGLTKVATRYRFDINYIAHGDLSGTRKELADRLAGAEDPVIAESKRGRPAGRHAISK